MITNEQLAQIRAEQEDAAKAAIAKDREEAEKAKKQKARRENQNFTQIKTQGMGRASKADEARRERGPVSMRSWRNIWGRMAHLEQAAGHWPKHSKSESARCPDTSRPS